MLLFAGISILICPSISVIYLDYAMSLLKDFVMHYGQIYGKDIIVYNVHGIIHLAEDVKRHGHWDKYSSFPYENNLQKLKKMVRKPKYPLAQIIRRLSEQESATKPKTPCTSFKKKHCKGPVPVELNALKQFEEMQTENFVIKLTKGDNIFLIRDYVCEISNIVQYTDFVYVMFLVVEFTLCNSTSIIPQEWYNNGETWWPDYQNDHRIARAAMNREEPGQSWEKFDVRVLILTSYLTENYEKARIKLKEADSIDTADLQSEEDDMDKGRGKRKRTSSLVFNIIGIYYPPKTDLDEIIEDILTILNTCDPSIRTVLGGDFNLHYGGADFQSVSNILSNFGLSLQSNPTSPTYFSYIFSNGPIWADDDGGSHTLKKYLASGNSQASICFEHRCGRSTVSTIIRETNKAIYDALQSRYLQKPNADEWQSIAKFFEDRWNFLNCAGAIDGKHVAIQAPSCSRSDYFNYKGYFSVVLMATCDAKYSFTMVDIGSNGRGSDGAVFAKSSLFDLTNLDLPLPCRVPGTEKDFPFVFVGDETFPLKENVLGPYPGRSLNHDRRICYLIHSLLHRYLASGNSQASICFEYRCGRSTVSTIIRETNKAICDALQSRYLQKPNSLTTVGIF
ncbi:Protein ANTAGONIST OF LIKE HETEROCHROMATIN PROTEIN 1 [Nymphon striatum]|nr:Protein ANTAGONIST OF LIKE HETEROCHROMATIN PROTEIN 1 [Nymphon striatum]